MTRKNVHRIGALALISFLVFAAGCLLNPDDNKTPAKTTAQFKSLADKENVIFNLALSYQQADITHYEELLHPNYTWYFQSADLLRGLPVFWTREQDLDATTNIFRSARGQNANPMMNLDRIALEITAGSWAPVDSVGGAPCNDCWTTTREYSLSCMTSGGLNGFTGNDMVQFVVVPVGDGGQKVYKIWQMRDLRMPGHD
jgi:hypothetical protein